MCAAEGGLSFEVVVGQNGRVWIDSPSTMDTVAVANAVQQSDGMSDSQTASFARTLLEKLPAATAAMDTD